MDDVPGALGTPPGSTLGIDSLDGIPVVPAPTSAELDALRRRVDPLGIRKLEFVPSRDRGPLLEATIRAEAELAEPRPRAPVLPGRGYGHGISVMCQRPRLAV